VPSYGTRILERAKCGCMACPAPASTKTPARTSRTQLKAILGRRWIPAFVGHATPLDELVRGYSRKLERFLLYVTDSRYHQRTRRSHCSPHPSSKPSYQPVIAMRGGMLSVRARRRKCSHRQERCHCVPATSARARGTHHASALKR